MTLLVLETQSLNYARQVSRSVREKINKEIEFLEKNGVPKCDYIRHKITETCPRKRFSDAVKRLISMNRIKKKERFDFADLVNCLKNSGQGQ